MYFLLISLLFNNFPPSYVTMKLWKENKYEEAYNYIKKVYENEKNSQKKCDIAHIYLKNLYFLAKIEEMNEIYEETMVNCDRKSPFTFLPIFAYSGDFRYFNTLKLENLFSRPKYFMKSVKEMVGESLREILYINYFNKNQIKKIKGLLDKDSEFLKGYFFGKGEELYCEVLFSLEYYDELLKVCKWQREEAFAHEKFLILLSLMAKKLINKDSVKFRAEVILKRSAILHFGYFEDFEILFYLAEKKEPYELHKMLNEKRLKYFPYMKAVYDNYWKIINEYFSKD